MLRRFFLKIFALICAYVFFVYMFSRKNLLV